MAKKLKLSKLLNYLKISQIFRPNLHCGPLPGLRDHLWHPHQLEPLPVVRRVRHERDRGEHAQQHLTGAEAAAGTILQQPEAIAGPWRSDGADSNSKGGAAQIQGFLKNLKKNEKSQNLN